MAQPGSLVSLPWAGGRVWDGKGGIYTWFWNGWGGANADRTAGSGREEGRMPGMGCRHVGVEWIRNRARS